MGYATSTGTNEFFYVDTNRNPEERPAEVAYNKEFHLRKTLLGTSATINTKISLNRYSFFEALKDELLPNSRIEINFSLESDAKLIWQAADDCRVIITKLQLVVPRLTFNSEGTKLYMSKFLDTRKWTYLKENVERSNSLRLASGSFRISSGINRPRHVFVFILNEASLEDKAINPFLYNTFSVSKNPRTLTECHFSGGRHR